MDREHVKGAADKAKGSIKETAGKISGDTELQCKRDVTTPSRRMPNSFLPIHRRLGDTKAKGAQAPFLLLGEDTSWC